MLMGDFLHTGSGPKILGSSTFHLDVPHMDDYTPAEKLHLEHEALGFSLSSNEMELYSVEAAARGAVSSRDLPGHAGREVRVAGVIAAGRRHLAKDGEWMLFLTLQDTQGLIEVVLFPDAYRENGDVLANGGFGPYLVRGQVQVSGKGRGIGVQPPSNLRPSDVVCMKMHPILIAEQVTLLSTEC
jgi:DNA polymerase-3 subunit alpha